MMLNSSGKYRLTCAFIALAAAACSLCTSAKAQPTSSEWPAKIVCSAWSGDPSKYPAWQDNVVVNVEGAHLTIERSSQNSKDLLEGLIAPSGAILLAGHGGRHDGTAEWVYEFKGQKTAGGAILKGTLVNSKGGIGARDCSIMF